MTNPNDPIHPLMSELVDKINGKGSDVFYNHTPLTKREYFAASVFQGIISSPNTHGKWEKITEVSVKVADLLIEQLNKQPEDGKETIKR